MKNLRMRAQLVRCWMRDVPQKSYTAGALVCVEVAVLLIIAGILHGLRHASTVAQVPFAFFAIALLLFVSLVGVVFLAIERYFSALERTQDLGVLRVLGASSGYIFWLLLMDTVAICTPASVAGIALTFLARWGAAQVFPKLVRVDIACAGWPIALGVAVSASMIGSIIGARKATRDGVTQALSYEP